MFENVLIFGLISMGMNVLLLGFVLMLVVGMLIMIMCVDVGIMISVSYNFYYDNGIKFFGFDGFKLFDEVEVEIEVLVFSEIELVQFENIGCVKWIDDGWFCYVECVKLMIFSGICLDGFKVVIDCVNGVVYKVVFEVFWELGVIVILVGIILNGFNINDSCGLIVL